MLAQHFSAAKARAPSGTMAAIALMVSAVALFAFLDAIAKHLSASLPVMQVVWMRFVTHLAFAFILLRLWANHERLKTGRPVLQGVRGLLLLSTTVFNFLAVQYLQLAETASIMFAGPMVVAALAVPLLGEHVGIRRWAAIAVGFMGVLVVTRPGLDGLGWPALISVGAMVSFAGYSLATRVLAQTEIEDGLVFYTAAIPAVALAPWAISVWVWPTDAISWALMLLTGLIGGGGHWLLIKAHRGASASTLAPFVYTQIIWMILLGWLWFGDIPTGWTLLGASIIIASGLYLLYREHVNRRLAQSPSEPTTAAAQDIQT
ncbi:MAG: DMT family transporter [Devosiaceae bacterium]|nr:DMT family transporter [Devosiaceae bacterium MH13]